MTLERRRTPRISQLAVDSLGRVVLALRDGNNVLVFRREGSQWKPFIGKRTMAVEAEEFRLALDARDQPVDRSQQIERKLRCHSVGRERVARTSRCHPRQHSCPQMRQES